MNPRRLFIASCIALVTSAFTFVVRGDILQPMGDAFGLSQQAKGSIEGAVFLGMAASMLIGGFICDLLGMKRIMFLAFWCHLIGVLGTIFAPQIVGEAAPFSQWAFEWLYFASFLMGCGNGMVETGINPLAATLYSHDKTHYLNILHAWWPGGLVLGGLCGRFIGQGIDLGFVNVPGMEQNWRISLLLILFPCLLYGAMFVGQRFPLTERVESGVSTGEMFLEAVRPAFLLWAFCMLLTAATELGPQKWQESVMTRTAGVSGTLILVYTSGMMFVMRHFAGPLAHAFSPVGMLTGSAILSALGLYLLSFATTAWSAFAYATIYGLGIAYFWPTMLGVTAERFPKGGALLLCLMGSAGNLSISEVLPRMGQIYDHYAVAEVTERNPELARQIVRGGAINQDIAKKISLLATLSESEKRDIDPRSWLTESQKAFLKSDDLRGQWAELEDSLSAEQRLILVELLDLDDKNDRATRAALQQQNLTPTQQDVFAGLDQVRHTISSLHLLREIEAAQLTKKQRDQLSRQLEEQGETGAADKLKKDQVEQWTTREKAIVAAAVHKLDLTNEQKQILQKAEDVEKAEAVGAAMAFRWVSVLPCLLVFIFGAIALTDRLRGGYKVVRLGEAEKESTESATPDETPAVSPDDVTERE
ncbi:MAG: hypothetical protein KatS3mg105_3040 [Gemmatales bacterium]|nr:MAG: hypothetical protein KatS3mg105_3040 [Gemmatales bacterium]